MDEQTINEEPRRINLDLYDQEFWVLDQAERITGIRTRSATIRHIINEWGKRNLIGDAVGSAPMFSDK